jgi:hypothetical protein
MNEYNEIDNSNPDKSIRYLAQTSPTLSAKAGKPYRLLSEAEYAG